MNETITIDRPKPGESWFRDTATGVEVLHIADRRGDLVWGRWMHTGDMESFDPRAFAIKFKRVV